MKRKNKKIFFKINFYFSQPMVNVGSNYTLYTGGGNNTGLKEKENKMNGTTSQNNFI
jgi:hypothetical protein